MAEDIMPHWLGKRAQLTPHTVALEQANGDVITFLDLDKRSRQCARQMHGIGVREGMHVGLLSYNQLDMAVMIHALSYLGAVIVLLNPRLVHAELAYQIEDADVNLIFATDELYNFASQLKVDAPLHSFSNIGQIEAANTPLKETINLQDPFTIIYTSGTTGSPKGVIHTYGNHWWSAIGSVLNLGLQDNDKWLCVLPMFHVGGLSILFRSVMYGIPVYLLTSFDEQTINDAIRFQGVTIASVVTVMLQRLIADLKEKTYPDTFRCMLIGGGPVPEGLLKEAQNRHIPVVQTYGLTETSSQIATLSAQDAFQKLGSAGKPLMPAQLQVDAPPGVPGEIYVKGPMVTSGYYQRLEASQASIVNGWLKTGDLGRFDDEGYLFVIERYHDLIISGGENVYPTEIENIIYKAKGVKETAVVGKKDQQWGQVPVAFVVMESNAQTSKSTDDIRQHLMDSLAAYKQPQKIVLVDSLPRNATNKVMRHKLAEYTQNLHDS